MAHLHWLGVVIATVAYFAFGSMWYMALFSKVWAREAGIKMDQKPTQREMTMMMLKSLLGNFVQVVAVALLLSYAQAGGTDVLRAMKIGAVAGFGIFGGATWLNNTWLMRSTTLWMIDTGHTVLGCAISAAILAAM